MEVRRLGKYELLESIGKGGFGKVYRARETVLDVERAVKVLHPALITDTEFLERFRREARIAARLEHPNIVPVYELDQDQGVYFLAMKFMPGGSLNDLLKRQGRLPFERAVKITSQIAAALDLAHSLPEKLIHRDVKPGNILFTADGTACLNDFGFAKALQGVGSASLSSTGGMIGTPPYMAPEAWGGQEVTPATDVYGLACVFYEMITGDILFGGKDTPEVITKHVITGPQFPQNWPEGVPKDIEVILSKALAKAPEERYQSSGEFTVALHSLVEAKPPPVKPESLPGPASEIAEEVPIPADEEMEPIGATPASERGEEKVTIAAGETVKPEITLPPAAPRRWWQNWEVWVGFGLCILLVVLMAKLPSRPSHAVETPLAAEQEVAEVPQAGDTWVSPVDGMVMVNVPAGEFLMGSADSDIDAQFDEKPQHRVYLELYWIDRTEVTNAMYAQCVQAGVCKPPGSMSSSTRPNYYEGTLYANYPVINVSWEDATKYCEWAGRRLPTEAEWEKAARWDPQGKEARRYPWGETISCDYANYSGCIGDTSEVGSYLNGASSYGALDMAGNVWEWVVDWLDDGYYDTYQPDGWPANPSGPSSGESRVLRGGSWYLESWWARTTCRLPGDPSSRNEDIGFRCARSP